MKVRYNTCIREDSITGPTATNDGDANVTVLVTKTSGGCRGLDQLILNLGAWRGWVAPSCFGCIIPPPNYPFCTWLSEIPSCLKHFWKANTLLLLLLLLLPLLLMLLHHRWMAVLQSNTTQLQYLVMPKIHFWSVDDKENIIISG
jgi:hypothetical protein